MPHPDRFARLRHMLAHAKEAVTLLAGKTHHIAETRRSLRQVVHHTCSIATALESPLERELHRIGR
jgi:nicotinate-nucleotide pyrophosphorylase